MSDYAGLQRCLMCKTPCAGQLCELCTQQIHGGRGDDPGESPLAWARRHRDTFRPGWLRRLDAKPYLALGVAAAALVIFFTVHAAWYRDVLDAFLPGSWVASEAGADGKSDSVVVVVALVLGLPVVGLTLLRRAGARRWQAGTGARATFIAWCAAATFLRTLLLVTAPGLIGAAGTIADAKDLEEPSTGSIPGGWIWIGTLAIVAWVTTVSVRRAIRKSTMRRFADWWLGIDGALYPPREPEGTYDAESMRWLATDGLWYPPPADDSGPAGEATGWSQGDDGLWYPPQVTATS